MAEVERIDIVKLTISNEEFRLIMEGLDAIRIGYCSRDRAHEDAAGTLIEELNGK